MSAQRLADDIRELERQIEELRAARPAHDTTGSHDMELMLLQDELDPKHRALAGRQQDAPQNTGEPQRN
jgi:hypothetical protein